VFYLIGQIAVFLMLTAIIGLAVGWLVRGINARAEIDAIKRQAQVQMRDVRNRAAASARSDQSTQLTDAARVNQQLRHQVVKLQGVVEQRDKEIAHLRHLLGDRRSARGGGGGAADAEGSGGRPASRR
jgi:hypothetical protein